MQHDTSPHRAQVGGAERLVQTVSLVLCYSRRIYLQAYPSLTRFACKVFLADALRYFSGAAKRCMIDNTHVVVLRGTGKTMVPVRRWRPSASGSVSSSRRKIAFDFRAH